MDSSVNKPLAATPAHYTLVPTQEADDIDVDSSDVRPDLADEAETEWCSGASTALSVAVILLLLHRACQWHGVI